MRGIVRNILDKWGEGLFAFSIIGGLIICGTTLAISLAYDRNDLQKKLTNCSLRKMLPSKEHEVTQGSASGWFFLFAGQANGSYSETTETTVTFAWEYNGSYVISTVPLQKMRVRISDLDTAPPSVTLVVNKGGCGFTLDGIGSEFNSNQNGFLDKFIDYVEVTCRSEDWPTEISLPLQRERVSTAN